MSWFRSFATSSSSSGSRGPRGASPVPPGYGGARTAPPMPPPQQPPQQPLHVSEEFGECAVCFESLCSQQTAVFVASDGRTRTCAHYFHLRCAKSVANYTLACPICRAPFAAVKPVPSPHENPEGWFATVDLNGDGQLSQAEVLEVLRAQLPVDWHAMETELPRLWSRFDPNGDGFIERHEMMRVGGLLEYVSHHFPRQDSSRPPAPSIAQAPHEWFSYWDEDGSGELEQEEVVRALIKTFRLSSDLSQVRDMRGILEAVWGIFDPDGSGSISREEFLMRDGLAETIVASAGELAGVR